MAVQRCRHLSRIKVLVRDTELAGFAYVRYTNVRH